MRLKGLIAILLFTSITVWAQDRTCGTDELLFLNKTAADIQLERDRFESWLKEQSIKPNRLNALERTDEEVIYQIPVVVHIIHKGEPQGTGTNLAEEQILSQIQALNADFRHLNSDSVNTPEEFWTSWADIGIEFVLANQNPEGFLTNGITRTIGGSTAWSMSNNLELKELSYWPSEDYFNIWVAPLNPDLLGWAQFPSSAIIPGVNEYTTDNPLTDGVVVASNAFGSKTLYPDGFYRANFNEGRTLTHEVGHFFGLRHIWGDGNCSEDDYVNDTPSTDDNYTGCPDLSQGYQHSCDSEQLSMYMNYMDYVYDACMNLFTLGQKERMQIVLNNSPRRASLLSSSALEPPPPLEVAIIEVTDPGIGTCSDVIYPKILVQNSGTTTINSLNIEVLLDGFLVQNSSFNPVLPANDSQILEFSSIILPDYGIHELLFQISNVNGGIDDNLENNSISQQVNYSQIVTSIDEQFSSWPESWAIRSEAPLSKWQFIKAPNGSLENTAAVLNYYDNSLNSEDQLITPTLDLSGNSSAHFLFDYSYVGGVDSLDDLFVVLSNDCGNNFSDTLFTNSGVLSRPYRHPVNYSPAGPSDWQTIILDLSNYVNQSVQIAFVGKSNGGNNIYLDNFKLVDDSYTDISIKGLVNETATYSSKLNSIGLLIENSGLVIIDDLEVIIKEGELTVYTEIFNTLDIQPGARTSIEVNPSLVVGKNELKFEIGDIDSNPGNNYFSSTINITEDKELIPFRQLFKESSWNMDSRWSINSPGDELTWEFNGNGFIGISAFNFGNKGIHDWLVLPNLDFSESIESGFRFKLAYADNNYNNELLRIWLSTNDGQTFEHLVKTYDNEELITRPFATDFTPSSPADWQTKFIDLSEFFGEESVLIAFEITDGDGSNLFLDDIEVFVDSDKEAIDLDPGKMAAYPNPVTSNEAKLTFSLLEKEDIHVRIIDTQGHIISDQVFSNVVNQTFPLDLSSARNGIYIIQAIGPSFVSTQRLMLNRQ